MAVYVKCSTCGGKGTVPSVDKNGKTIMITCSSCGGKGGWHV
jgi:translation initiation factor 2 beta subunit (eIF-2beta)/eIF-5